MPGALAELELEELELDELELDELEAAPAGSDVPVATSNDAAPRASVLTAVKLFLPNMDDPLFGSGRHI